MLFHLPLDASRPVAVARRDDLTRTMQPSTFIDDQNAMHVYIAYRSIGQLQACVGSSLADVVMCTRAHSRTFVGQSARPVRPSAGRPPVATWPMIAEGTHADKAHVDFNEHR